MDVKDSRAFPTPAHLDKWLRANHAVKQELWVRIYKKGSGVASVDWNDCVVAALTWGWIDGLRRANDAASFFLRMTPRRPRSIWSKRNCEHAERLIAEGRMQPPGLKQVEAARNDGRWAKAYAGSSTMEIPADFLKELRKNPAAKKFYATLDRTNLFAIYHRLHTAKTPETRKKRVASIIERLAAAKTFH